MASRLVERCGSGRQVVAARRDCDVSQTARHRASRLGLVYDFYFCLASFFNDVRIFKSRLLIFQVMIFSECQFLVLSVFAHVIPLLIGLACIEFQDVVCAMTFQVAYIDVSIHVNFSRFLFCLDAFTSFLC